ncbi:MAG TPA: hypothetical protein VJ785_09140 [Anaerolineales bacterium]|nr:hypothetical protein [Anaerolineales bacterium]
MDQDPIIVFVCEHGAAKSVIAAAYFNKLAAETGLSVRAIARGTNPDPQLSPTTVAGLHADDMLPTNPFPQKLSPADVESARRIVSFCDLHREYQYNIVIEKWDDIPPVSENYEKARDAILKRLSVLIAHL